MAAKDGDTGYTETRTIKQDRKDHADGAGVLSKESLHQDEYQEAVPLSPTNSGKADRGGYSADAFQQEEGSDGCQEASRVCEKRGYGEEGDGPRDGEGCRCGGSD